MARTNLRAFLFLFCPCLFAGSYSQKQRPECPEMGGVAYVPHEYPCYFYTCYNGNLVTPDAHKCPEDSQYYQMLLDSGVQNPCSSCAKYYLKPDGHDPGADPETTSAEVTSPPTPKVKSTESPPDGSTEAVTTTTTSVAMVTDPPTDATPGATLKEIHAIRTGSHVFGGRWAAGVGSLRQCLQACEEGESCVGFDYSTADMTCWLHNLTTVCTPPQLKDSCVHFNLYQPCPGVTDMMPTMPDIPTPKPTDTDMTYTVAFKGQHLPNGTVIPLAMEMANPQTCVAICRMDEECVGADFDESSKSCWLHSEDTECAFMMPKPACTHYHLEDVCEEDPPATEMPTDPPSGQTTTPTDKGDIVEPELVTAGFAESVSGFHVPGGVLVYSHVSLRQCLDGCLVTPYCLALDYDEYNNTCYFHFRDSYCREPRELRGVKHFKRLPCVAELPNDVATTWYRFHAEEGQLLCTGCTLSFCMEACFADMGCAGIDYDDRDLGCYLFTPDTVCGPLIPKDYCIHVSRYTCVPAELANVPPQNLALSAYPPPPGLPSGWLAYPGIRVRNGVQIGPSGMDPAQCVALCQGETSCLSGDFNTADGSCWLHLTPERQCGQPEVSDTVFHFKKDRCDFVFGVMERYPSPVWTAP